MIGGLLSNCYFPIFHQKGNVEFPWDPDSLSPVPPIEGLAMFITADMPKVARGKMKLGKAPGLSRLCAEMLVPLEEIADEYLEKLYNIR